MKKIISMLLMAMLVLSALSCVAVAEEDKPTIAFVPKVIGQAWWYYVEAGVH